MGRLQRNDRLPVLAQLQDRTWLLIDYLSWPGWIPSRTGRLVGEPRITTPEAPPPTCVPVQIRQILLSESQVTYMNPITLTCELETPIAEGLSYTWTASGGELSGAGAQVTYTADEWGRQTITVAVESETCGGDERSMLVDVIEEPRPTGSPELDPNSIWGRIWHTPSVRRKIGWATESEHVTHAAQQDFQRGHMFWLDELGVEGEPCHVLFEDGTWKLYYGTWQEGMPEHSCPDVAPPQDPRTPKRGFGDIWCNQMGGPNSAIGWAREQENGYYPLRIRFQRGIMVQGYDERVYVIYDDGTWEVGGEGAVSLHVLDDFEGYADGTALSEVYGVTAPGGNEGSLHLAQIPYVASGDRGAAFDYRIVGRSPDYCGFDRAFDPPQDWRAYDTLRVWVRNEGGGSTLVVQFREAGGELWKRRFDLSSLGARHLDIALEQSTLELTDEPLPDTRLELGQIDQIGFYVNGREGVRGTLYVDSIRLIRRER
jgi:hypothetical protein